jgi:hypothetical protein
MRVLLLLLAAFPAFGYTIGGTVSGFNQSVIVLRLNNSTSKILPANITSYQFSTSLVAGTAYSVSVGIQPAGLRCTVANASGISFTDVTNANITCVPLTSVQVYWTLPTQNTDGTPLTDLTGYMLYYGTDSTLKIKTTKFIPVPNLSTTVSNLAVGNIYYFSIASVSASGGVGPQSNFASVAK